MRTLMKSLASLVSIAAVALLVAACGGGYGSDDATNRCEIDRTNNETCFEDDTLAACLDCYEECGDECQIAESCPLQYVCATE